METDRTPAKQTGGAPDGGAGGGWGAGLAELVRVVSTVSKVAGLNMPDDNINADEMTMYYDEKLGKWVDPSSPEGAVDSAAAGPPPVSMGGGGQQPQLQQPPQQQQGVVRVRFHIIRNTRT